MKIAFVHNICAHYTAKAFEILARHYNVDYLFYSKGGESYWMKEHGVGSGEFNYDYLSGFNIGNTRITPSLPIKLYRGRYEVFIKCIGGRFALPTTYIIARLKRRPFILWTGVWIRINTRSQRFFFPLTRHIYRHSDAIVVYGDHVKRYLISEGVQASKIFIAHHSVDNSLYNYQVQLHEKENIFKFLNIERGKKIILYLGRFIKRKGLNYLLEAYKNIDGDDTVLVIAGTGPEMEPLKHFVEENDMAGRVRFPGYVPIEETIKYYAIAWVYVLPSISIPVSKEPWGLVVNEAFNQGVPVITTDAVGAAAGGLVQDGVNGFIVPEQDSQALANAIKRILVDAGLRGRMSRKAKEIIEEWTHEKMVSGFQQAIKFVSEREKEM